MKYFNRVIIYLILIIGSAISIFPFYWNFIKAVTPEGEIFHYPPQLYVSNFTLDNISHLIAHIPFLRNLLNTFFVSTSYTILTLFLCSLAGYAFAKFEFPFKNVLFIFMISTMALPFAVQLIPLFIIMTRLKWINNYLALIIPWAANAFGIFWMKQYIQSIPADLLDAARIDGSSEFRIFIQIIIPNIKPALFSLGIIQFLFSYNDFLWPLIVMNNNKMYTAPLALALLKSSGMEKPYWGEIMAGSALLVIPVIIIFLVLQKYIVSGIMKGAIKE